MDKSLLKLLYTKPYKSHIVWNVIYNILYALFSTISMLTLLPVIEVLFGKQSIINPFIQNRISNNLVIDYLNYKISFITWQQLQVVLTFCSCNGYNDFF
jgi:subfamily B ATP-binding cassette protein MsbA